MSFSPIGPQSPIHSSPVASTSASKRSSGIQAYSIPEEPSLLPLSSSSHRKPGMPSNSSASSSAATSPHHLYHQYYQQSHHSTGNAQLNSPTSPSRRVPSALKGASYGSTSSLLSFDDLNNSMYKKQPPLQQQQQQQPIEAFPIHHQQHSRNLSSGNVANPLSTSFLPTSAHLGGSERLHYNPHTSPRLQTLAGSNYSRTSPSHQITTADQASINNPPHLPYSPITSNSPVTPKTNAASIPWTSPQGTPSSRQSPNRLQGHKPPPLPLSLQPPSQPQLDPTSNLASRSLSSHYPTSDQQLSQYQQITSPIRTHHNSTSQIRPHISLATSQQASSRPVSYVLPQSILAPSFRRIRSKSELTPSVNAQPKYRRALPEGGSLSPLAALTKQLPTTYHICNPAFNFQSSKNPRRILTKPGEAKLNNGFDNADSDYILYVNDILGIDEQRRYVPHFDFNLPITNFIRYLVLDVLGQGTFGQVVKCQNMITKEIAAVKVIKNKPAYLKQSMMEVSILNHLNSQVDPNDNHHLLRLKDRFMHKSHLCLVFELLSSNLYELIKRNNFRGLSINLVRVFAQQLLDSLKVLKDAKLIHCDLKPENILLRSLDSPVIKVIDFGSACHELQTVYTYIQSRFYRSPEVLLGLPYTTSIDMWSLGCIVAELFLGLPIFPGTSEYNQLSRITDSLGMPPNWMIDMGKASAQFMEKHVDEYGNRHYRLKSREKFSAEKKTQEQPSKQYFPSTKINEIIMNYPLPKPNMKKADIDREMQNRASFVDFVSGLLNMNPFERWTPHQAAMHPFITESKFVSPFVPPLVAKDKQFSRSQEENASRNQHFNQQGGHNMNHQPSHKQQIQPQQVQSQRTGKHTTGTDQQMKHQRAQNYYGNTGAYEAPHIQGASASGIHMKSSYASGNGPVTINSKENNSTQQSNTTGWSTRRQRASTIGNMVPIPPPIQRATAMMNPTQPIRAQPSPAYFPPPELIHGQGQSGGNRSRRPNANTNGSGDVVRHLEDGLNMYWN